MADFNPANHEYTTNATYTGMGCALCGKAEEGHKLPKPKPEGSTVHAPGCTCGFCKMGSTKF